MLLTVGFTVVQFTAVQQPFIAVDIVPIVDNHCLGKRPFVAVARKAEAVTQISGSFGFLFLGLVGFSAAEVVLEKGFLLKDRHKVRLAMNRL